MPSVLCHTKNPVQQSSMQMFSNWLPHQWPQGPTESFVVTIICKLSTKHCFHLKPMICKVFPLSLLALLTQTFFGGPLLFSYWSLHTTCTSYTAFSRALQRGLCIYLESLFVDSDTKKALQTFQCSILSVGGGATIAESRSNEP